jgi:hypothetical protein
MSQSEMVRNAVGREVPASVNGRPQTPYQGLGRRAEGRMHAPRIHSCADYPGGATSACRPSTPRSKNAGCATAW